MTLKILCIGDQHLDLVDVLNVQIFITEILKCIQKTNPDIVVCLGDMLHYHNTIYTQSLNNAYKFIESISSLKKTFILVGNHDMKGPVCFLDSESHWLNGMKKWENVVIVDKVIEYKQSEFKFIFLPYVQPQRFEEALNTIGDNWKDATCIFAHQEFYGCKMGIIDSIEGDKWEQHYPPVISGHIHDRQLSQKNIFYTGSSIQTSFCETINKTITLATICKCVPIEIPAPNQVVINNIQLTQYELHLPKKKIIYKTMEEIYEWVIPDEAKLKDNELPRDTYKITVKGVLSDFKIFKKSKKYKEIINEDIKIVFKHEEQIDINNDMLTNSTVLSFNQILYSSINKDDKHKDKLVKIFNKFTTS